MDPKGVIGLVPSRFGTGVVGGAEAVFAEVAHGLSRRGWSVEILTTTAKDHYTWADEFPPGISEVDGITVRRFPAVVSTPRAERHRVGAAVAHGRSVPLSVQEAWINDDLRVPELYHHLLDHSGDYRAIIFAPSIFWPAFACGQIAPDRTILMPCLHDEPESYFELFDPLFEGVRGLWFLSDPERDLALRIHPHLRAYDVIGAGVEAPTSYDPERFRARYGIKDPFVLFAGRREGGKGWEHLLEMFAAAVARAELPLSLVTMGVGDVRPPPSIADRVIDLGFLPDDERDDAFAAAAAYLQPSRNESFSRTIMEAWLAGTLVIASSESEVVKWHCERSGAGLTYDDEYEFEQCLRLVVDAPDSARALAAAGRPYVLANYNPEHVLDRIEVTLDAWTTAPEE